MKQPTSHTKNFKVQRLTYFQLKMAYELREMRLRNSGNAFILYHNFCEIKHK